MEVGSKAACRVSADRQLQQLRRANTEISESRLCAGTNAKLTFRIKVAQIIEDFICIQACENISMSDVG